jgi:hypothetical protein
MNSGRVNEFERAEVSGAQQNFLKNSTQSSPVRKISENQDQIKILATVGTPPSLKSNSELQEVRLSKER